VTVSYLGMGSNIDAECNIRSGVRALRDAFGEIRLSPIYRSRAVGFAGDDFINLVAAVDTRMTPFELRDWLRRLEDHHGRLRDVPKFSDRVLDIDILLYGDTVVDEPDLQLPRPEIFRFAHVLKPLADLAPDLELPGDGRTLARIWVDSGLDETPLVPLDPAFLDAVD